MPTTNENLRILTLCFADGVLDPDLIGAEMVEKSADNVVEMEPRGSESTQDEKQLENRATIIEFLMKNVAPNQAHGQPSSSEKILHDIIKRAHHFEQEHGVPEASRLSVALQNAYLEKLGEKSVVRGGRQTLLEQYKTSPLKISEAEDEWEDVRVSEDASNLSVALSEHVGHVMHEMKRVTEEPAQQAISSRNSLRNEIYNLLRVNMVGGVEIQPAAFSLIKQPYSEKKQAIFEEIQRVFTPMGRGEEISQDEFITTLSTLRRIALEGIASLADEREAQSTRDFYEKFSKCIPDDLAGIKRLPHQDQVKKLTDIKNAIMQLVEAAMPKEGPVVHSPSHRYGSSQL